MQSAKILDPALAKQLIAERQSLGLDKYDEVWDGVYVMSPLADDEHQRIATFISGVLSVLIQWTRRGEVRQGINLSDRPHDWTKSFRVPDVAVFFPTGEGVCHGSFWTGGPDFAVEIVSEGEDPYAKFEFYGRLRTRELLLVHRDPWRLELFESHANSLRLIQSADPEQSGVSSAAVNLIFRLQNEGKAIQLQLEHADGRIWSL